MASLASLAKVDQVQAAYKKLHIRAESDMGEIGLLAPSLQDYHFCHGDKDGPPRDIMTKELMRFLSKAAKHSKSAKRGPYLHGWFIWSTTVFLGLNVFRHENKQLRFQDLQVVAARVRETCTKIMSWSRENPDPDGLQETMKFAVTQDCENSGELRGEGLRKTLWRRR
jgi:hypothetical protein